MGPYGTGVRSISVRRRLEGSSYVARCGGETSALHLCTKGSMSTLIAPWISGFQAGMISNAARSETAYIGVMAI